MFHMEDLWRFAQHWRVHKPSCDERPSVDLREIWSDVYLMLIWVFASVKHTCRSTCNTCPMYILYFKSIELRLLQIAKRTIGEKRGARDGLRSQGRAHHLPPRPLRHPHGHRHWRPHLPLQEEGAEPLHLSDCPRQCLPHHRIHKHYLRHSSIYKDFAMFKVDSHFSCKTLIMPLFNCFHPRIHQYGEHDEWWWWWWWSHRSASSPSSSSSSCLANIDDGAHFHRNKIRPLSHQTILRSAQ